MEPVRPATKIARLDAIRQALLQTRVGSQQQLSEILRDQGIEVTQATLSRDLDDLHASKMRYPDGALAYWIPDSSDQTVLEAATVIGGEAGGENKTEQYLSKILSGLITSVVTTGNLLVMRTPAGAAQYAASALDRQSLDGVLGTIAGDDTVLVITSDASVAQERAHWLIGMTSGDE